MRKLGIVVVLGLALLLGQTWSAHADAVLVNDPVINTAPSGQQLFEVFNAFGWSSTVFNNAQIGAMIPADTLFPGTYYLTDEYKFSGKRQRPGWSPVSGPTGIFNQLDSLSYAADGPGNGYHTDPFTITPTLTSNNSFCFADKVDGDLAGPTRYTVLSYNSPVGFQSNGFIFLDPGTGPFTVDLDGPGGNPPVVYNYKYHLIVAFEDADIAATYNYCDGPDLDYHDLVLNIFTDNIPIPIPGTLALLGSGLLGLAGLGWWRRRS